RAGAAEREHRALDVLPGRRALEQQRRGLVVELREGDGRERRLAGAAATARAAVAGVLDPDVERGDLDLAGVLGVRALARDAVELEEDPALGGGAGGDLQTGVVRRRRERAAGAEGEHGGDGEQRHAAAEVPLR